MEWLARPLAPTTLSARFHNDASAESTDLLSVAERDVSEDVAPMLLHQQHEICGQMHPASAAAFEPSFNTLTTWVAVAV